MSGKRSTSEHEREKLWAVLSAGGPFDDFPRHDGRVDLRKTRFASPKITAIGTNERHPPRSVSPTPSLRKVHLQDIDFSGSEIKNLSTAQSSFTRCRFDKADFRYWLMWSTKLADCSFLESKLTDSQLGALLPDGTQIHFERVQFIRSRMQYINCSATIFDRCLFDSNKLNGTEFGSACTFRNCTFRGEVRDVLFGTEVLITSDRRRFYDPIPQGVLESVDFSQAILREVGFYDVRIHDVKWPDPTTHIVLTKYRTCIQRLLAELPHTECTDIASRYFNLVLESLGPHEGIGVFYKPDLIKLIGQRDASIIIPLMERMSS